MQGERNIPKPTGKEGQKNYTGENLKKLRKITGDSQRSLAIQLQCLGLDIDKNVITRIETNKRYVTDIELKAFAEYFNVSYETLIDGDDEVDS